jgi:6-phosphogluconolactonase (cycloisomerase 2 family)
VRYFQASVSSLADGVSNDDVTAAEVWISRDSKYVYSSNRDVANPSQGRSSIAVFEVVADYSNAMFSLNRIQVVSSRGDYPRYFQLVNEGSSLLLLNQMDNSVVSFEVDPVTGMIDEGSATITKPDYPSLVGPSCTLFRDDAEN